MDWNDSVKLNTGIASRSFQLVSLKLSNADMQTVSDIRHANLLLLVEQAGTARALADLLDRSQAQISQLVTRAPYPSGKPRAVGDELARDIEKKLGKTAGWMDTPPRARLAAAQGSTPSLSPRAASLASRLDALIGQNQARAFAIMDFTLRAFESDQD